MGKHKKKRKYEESEEYHVEVIIAARVANGDWEYRVKWAGYDSDADSWEPGENVQRCDRLLESFWMHVGISDYNDYPDNHEIWALDSWIQEERAYFAREFAEIQKQEKKRAKLEKTLKNASSKKTKSRGGSETASRTSSKGKGKAKQTSQLVSDSEEEEPIKIKIKRRLAASPENDEVSLSQALPKKPKTTLQSVSASDKGKQKEPESPAGNENNSLFTPPSSKSGFAEIIFPPSPVAPPGVARITIPAPSHVPSNKLSGSKSLSRTEKPRGVKVLPLQSSASALETKQRIVGGQSTTTQSAQPSKASALANLSFRKKPISITPTLTPDLNTSTSERVASTSRPLQAEELDRAEPSFTTNPSTPPKQTPSAFLPGVTSPASSPSIPVFRDAPVVGSPTSAHSIPEVSQFDDSSFFDDPPPPPLTSFQEPKDPGTQATEDFLNSIMPEDLAAPLRPAPESAEEPVLPNMGLKRGKLPSLPKIPKKWKWNGSIFLEHSRDKSELLCNASVIDVSDPVPGGHRMSIFLDRLDSLHIGKFHHLVDVDEFLLACKKTPQQYARLVPQADKDVEPLKHLTYYLGRFQQTVLYPLNLDGVLVAWLLFLSPAAGRLHHLLDVPREMREHGNLVLVMVVRDNLPVYKEYEWRKATSAYDSSVAFPKLHNRNESWWATLPKGIRHDPALRQLGFPKDLHSFITTMKRKYCTWSAGGDGKTTKHRGRETSILDSFMTSCGAENVGLKADVRLVFVHVGALRTFSKLPALVERRTKRPDVSFYTYGSHESVPPHLWGIRSIYKIGGIVTFTPSALLEDPLGIYQRITQIAQHPLWECYVLPSVLGMVAKVSSGDEDPLVVFDRDELYCDFVLDFIERGSLGILRAPPLFPTLNNTSEQADAWRRRHERTPCLSRRDILEDALSEFNSLFSNHHESQWTSLIEKEISRDLMEMQLQPVLMDYYRRYVVVKGSKDDHLSWDKDGFEWTTNKAFSFKDEFHKPPGKSRAGTEEV